MRTADGIEITDPQTPVWFVDWKDGDPVGVSEWPARRMMTHGYSSAFSTRQGAVGLIRACKRRAAREYRRLAALVAALEPVDERAALAAQE